VTADVDRIASLIAPVLRVIEVEAVTGLSLTDTPAAALRIAEAIVSADEACAEFGSHPRGRHHETLLAALPDAAPRTDGGTR
jgi:hypothetical protein